MMIYSATRFLSPTMGAATANVSPHPLLVQAVRPLLPNQQCWSWSFSLHRSSSSAMTTRYYRMLAVWKKNFSRLYARRMMELAIASAAAHRLRTQAEASIIKPIEWQDWQRKDWDDTALASVGRTKFQRFWMAAKRVTQLTVLSTPLMVLVPLSYVSQQAHVAAWNYALWGIEQAGPTWIKLMQWASTRQDLFSPEFCQHFGKLRDETEGHSWEETKQILEAELGEKGLESLKIEERPIGSGCIAQVYQGRLLEPSIHYPKGTKLAIKVQHPGIWSKVCVDFYIFHKVAKFLEELPYLGLEYLSLVDSIRQFRDVMIPQLDLTIESSHLKRFNKNFASNDQITFPRPLDELTTDKVLVETFSDGKPIIEYTKDETPKPEREQLAKLGLEMTLQMIFLHDFIHGDLHPGNILVEGRYPKLKLHVLDCGLALEMGPEQHVNIVKVLGAFTRRDGTLAGQLMVDMKSESQANEEQRRRFIEGIEQICIMDEDQNFIECVGDYIADICSMACKNRVKLEGAFVNAALAVEIMEGLASALYPDLKVQQVALPLIVKAEMMHRLGWH